MKALNKDRKKEKEAKKKTQVQALVMLFVLFLKNWESSFQVRNQDQVNAFESLLKLYTTAARKKKKQKRRPRCRPW